LIALRKSAPDDLAATALHRVLVLVGLSIRRAVHSRRSTTKRDFGSRRSLEASRAVARRIDQRDHRDRALA
jgi:hypothetical protein